MKLIAVFPTAMPMAITAIQEEVAKTLGIGAAFALGQSYIALALATDAPGNIYALTQNDNGQFIWLSDLTATIRPYVVQQARPDGGLIVPQMNFRKSN